jgi:flavin-dependent dehydrogenase
LPEKHGPHWIAVGDAVVKLDPLGSSGTATALDSGLRAAHAVADALLGSGTDLDRYGRWSTGLVEEFTRQRRQQYAIEALTRKDGFWPRRLARALEGGPNEGLHQRIDDRDQVFHGSSHRFKLNPSGMHLLSSLAKVTRSISPERLSGNFYNCWFTET